MVDLGSKKVVLGTAEKAVDMPKTTTKEAMSVPAICGTDGKKD